MKKLNKMPRSSYDAGKVLAYEAETTWVETHCDETKRNPIWGWKKVCYQECQFDPDGGDDCTIGSTQTVCYGPLCIFGY